MLKKDKTESLPKTEGFFVGPHLRRGGEKGNSINNLKNKSS